MCEGFQAYWYCAWAVGAPPESVHTTSERRVPRWVRSGPERPLLVCGKLGVSPRGWCCVLVYWEWALGADTILRFTYWARGVSFWFILSVEIICLYYFKRRIIWYSLFYCITDFTAWDSAILCRYEISCFQSLFIFITHWVGILTLLPAPCVQIQAELSSLLSADSFQTRR